MNRVFINEQGIIEEIFIGKQTFKKITTLGARAMLLRDKLKKTKKSRNDKLKTLVDLSQVTTITPDAMVGAFDLMRANYPTKSALFGGSKLINGLAGILIAASGKTKDIRIFDSRKEAEKWLGK